jgi:hypothetical protein
MNEYSKFLPVKSAIEDLFGKEAWYALKESNSIPDWKKYCSNTLKALRLSIQESVQHFDPEWIKEIDQEVARGLESIKRNSTIEDVIASLAGALINISFLQVGFMPRRKGQDVKITLRKENWDLSLYRSVIYLQSPDQLERKFWSEQQREMGFQNQIDLHYEYKASKSELPYSEWCASNEKA